MVNVAESYNEHAQRWADRLKEGKNAAHSLLEKPAMWSLLPDLTGKRVLAVGCGSGEEVQMLLAGKALEQDITGIDISGELLKLASTAYPAATFHHRSMEDLHHYASDTFDFVYSSLALHYTADWLPILKQVGRILRPGGSMLFSTHHPVKWSALAQRGEEEDSFTLGYLRPKQGNPTVYGDYLQTRRIEDVWFGMPVAYYHRPLSAIIGDILGSGLQLRGFSEPAPAAGAEVENPSFHAIHSKIPMFMIFDLVKPT